jgi:hypothetical protein
MIEGDPTDDFLERELKLYPRRYRRYSDLRTYSEACDWAQTLDWQKNPYDRYLLHRELMRFLEATQCYLGRKNLFRAVSREDVSTGVTHLLDQYAARPVIIGVFRYVLLMIPWIVGHKSGQIRYSRLTQALARLPSDEPKQNNG